MAVRDGHVHVLPLHVANKIAAGEVVERPASVVKELVENAVDAGAANIKVSIVQGGRKLVSVRDDGCGMTKDDALLSLERQATSKILDVDDIENIDTLGFRGEAIPSIASVSRFSLVTRRHDADEGTQIVVNAGELVETSTAGCPPGTLVEVRDLFCNVPARRKFLRSFATEEGRVKGLFTVHALAHPGIGFSLVVDGRELYRLAPATSLADRLLDIYGADFVESLIPLPPPSDQQKNVVRVSGYIEKPNLSMPTRRDQYMFVNGRPATAPSIAYAVREAYPHRQGDIKPALFLFIELPPNQVDVNVHPTKREVRFRDNIAVKRAITEAIEGALGLRSTMGGIATSGTNGTNGTNRTNGTAETNGTSDWGLPTPQAAPVASQATAAPAPAPTLTDPRPTLTDTRSTLTDHTPQPVAVELPLAADDTGARPWKWFKFLATTASGYLLIETDAGLVTINPHAARERIAFEQLLSRSGQGDALSQQLLIPETIHLSPVDAARITAALGDIEPMGFKIEPFGRDTFKIDAVPQLIGSLSPADVISTVARDLSEGGARRGERWREELVAKSIARSFAGMSLALDESGATKLVEELASCRMPYISPGGKPTMIFTSTRELDRRFAKS
ncbi:MAG: DNA mismatch repair endonuclease MutL [Kiritimatiellae bacterium]|nr:DNA mismatch repair endonuclease MutL [Kiritimatiellia bacterium]